MNDANQILIFIAAMLAGVASGGAYELNCLFRYFVKNRVALIAADILLFCLAGCIFAAFCVLFRLPDFRLYMFGAALLGLWLYTKTLHRIVAFSAQKLYNICRSVCKALAMRAAAYHERRKIQMCSTVRRRRSSRLRTLSRSSASGERDR